MPTLPPISAPGSGPLARPSCPSCGIAVTPGYQRCPKCHRPLPTSVRFTRPLDAGGATTIEPDEVVTRWPWYLAGLIVLAGAVAVIVVGSHPSKPAPALPDDPVVDEEPDDTPGAGVDEDEAVPTPPPRPDPAPAADRLARLMAAVRLYATTEAIGDTVEIRSTFCAEPRVPGIIADVAADLRAAGIVAVRCRALHGAEAWTRPLP